MLKPNEVCYDVIAFDERVAVTVDEYDHTTSLNMDADDAEWVAKEILKMVEKARKSPYYKKK